MTAVFSTSSPIASVALFGEDGRCVGSGSDDTPHRAGGACLRLLEELLAKVDATLEDVDLFVADAGPGSFTGVKVGITLAKTLAYAASKRTASVSSFDLVDPDALVAVPFRKGEWFVRRPGCEPTLKDEPPSEAVGYGTGMYVERFPHAERAQALLGMLRPLDPERLVPHYLAEPSISVPKTAYRQVGKEAGPA